MFDTELLVRLLDDSDGLPPLLGRLAIGIAAILVSTWILAFILSRLGFLWGGDALLRVYFGWLIPITLWSIAIGTLSVIAVFQFDSLGLPVFRSLPLVASVVVLAVVAYFLTRKIEQRVETLHEVHSAMG